MKKFKKIKKDRVSSLSIYKKYNKNKIYMYNNSKYSGLFHAACDGIK